MAAHPPPSPADDSLILWDVVDEHLDEAEFLFMTCRALLDAPDYVPSEVDRGPLARLRAHLLGLTVAGVPAVEQRLRPALEAMESPESVATAALAWLEQPDRQAVLAILRVFVEAPEPMLLALGEAAAWSGRSTLDAELASLGRNCPPELVGPFLRLTAARGVPPGPALAHAMRSDDPALQTIALTAARWADRSQCLPWIEARLGDPSASSEAIETGLAWGSRIAFARLSERAEAGDADALARISALGPMAIVDRSIKLLDDEAKRHAAVWALGWSGWPRAAEACLRLLEHEDSTTARLAGEAFAAITGLPRDDDRYWGETAEAEAELGDELPPLEEDLEADLSLPPEASLPLPNAPAIEAWWKDNHARFAPKTRYLAGRAMDSDTVVWGLREGVSMRRRHLLASLLAAHSRGLAIVPTRAAPSLTDRRLRDATIDPKLLFQRGIG